MHKNSIKRRKHKALLQKCIAFAGLFFISFGLLVLFYAFLTHQKKTVLSPLASLSHVLANGPTAQEQITTLLQKYNIQFTSLSIASDSSILVALGNDREAIISPEKPIEPQISSLQLMISRLTIEGQDFKRIDVRFDRPVVSSL